MKNIFPFALILAVVIATLAYGGETADIGLSDTYEATVITSCYAMGFHRCDIIIRNLIYKIDLKEGRSAIGEWMTFPSDFSTARISVYPRGQISCTDPKQIAVAKYNEEEGQWELLPPEDRQPPEEKITSVGAPTGAYTIKAPIRSPGIYAIVEKDPSAFGELAETEWCISHGCGDYEAYNILGSSGKINRGEQVTFSFCKMLAGCKPGESVQCSRACEQGADPLCPAVCTNEEGNCCFPVSDNKCDGDCWKIGLDGNEIMGEPDAGQSVIDSTDPDCIMGEGAELFKPYEYGDFKLAAESAETETPNPIPIEKVTRSAEWERFDWTAEEPTLLEGKIKVEVVEGKGVWMTNFTYIDLWDNEHKLFPIRPNRYGLSSAVFSQRMPAHQDMMYYFIIRPYEFYQDKNLPSDRPGALVQFDLPPTGVKKIIFYAKKRPDDREVRFKITMLAHRGNADPDGDNSTNYEDCHDNNPKIYPGAPERCNKIDDNCNGYNIYNHSVIGEAVIYNDINDYVLELAGSGGTYTDTSRKVTNWVWSYYDRGYIGGTTRGSYVMPCDGYIKFTRLAESAYFEIWKKDMDLCNCVGNNDPYPNNKGCPKTSGQDDTVSCNAEGGNGIWNSYQGIIGLGDDGAFNYEIYAYDDDEPGCIMGAHASCKIGALPPFGDIWDNLGSEEHFYAYNRNGIKIHDGGTDEEEIPQRWLDKMNNPANRIEVKEGEMLWGMTYGCNWDSDDDLGYYCDENFGRIHFDVYCYSKGNLRDAEGTPADQRRWVDEDLEPGSCEIKDKKTVHVCKTNRFDMTIPACADSSYCVQETDSDQVSCPQYTIPEDEPYGSKPFYTYICRDEDKDKDKPCYLFYEKADGFNVCALTENCHQLDTASGTFRNEDLDCDGDRPFKEDAEGNVLLDQPLDTDCIGQTPHGVCKRETKEWWDSSAGDSGEWKTQGYCQQCGATDSSCAISCEPGALSCGGGCLEGACDLAADKLCKGGSWTTTGYSSACGKNDSWFNGAESTVQCTPNACDTEFDKVCFGDPKTWRTTGGVGTPYCDLPACKVKDASCAKPCTPGVCDVFSNAYCTSTRTWSAINAADYCSKCGAIDSNCGSIPCTDTKADGSPNCDTAHKKFCDSGVWKDKLTEYCGKCSLVDEPTCLAECPPLDEQTATEINCTDGIDNNCDGTADCRDPACNYLDECRNACRFGVTDNCGPSEGICMPQGTRTCGMSGRWGECIGGTAPRTEICNAVDDNCDGAVDEGCVCTTGQSQACGFDSGSCRAGVQRCVDGKWGYCHRTSRASPTTEKCDGIDNDCDGEVDEGCPCVEGSNQSCEGTPGTICKAGLQVCADGKWGTCVGAVKPLTENRNTGNTCSDTIDNDCDGKVDAADDGCGITPADQLAPSCFDAKKNQGETDVDCGGPCANCVTPANCNNRKMDPGEEGVDCGGECSVPCNDRTRLRTSPSKEETEEETIAEPVCGDGSCDEGEDETCPKDCETPSTFSFTAFLLPAIIIIALILGGFVAYKKGLIKMKGKEAPKASFPSPKGMPSGEAKPSGAFKQIPASAIKAAAQKAPQRKEVKTREELELEKSFNEEKELLKK
ncbi:MAG: putative metal-binding motif-containing protein [Nanoarchaeota archaeon]|nr:putative metal-binding motif-containing protein [Nanoarchaeota archaeon]